METERTRPSILAIIGVSTGILAVVISAAAYIQSTMSSMSQERIGQEQVARLEAQIDNQERSLANQVSSIENQLNDLPLQQAQVDGLQSQFEIQQRQLIILEQLLTAQASDSVLPEDAETPDPQVFVQATQTAEAIVELQATSDALRQEQQSLSATQTALAIPTATPVATPTPPPAPVQQDSFELERFLSEPEIPSEGSTYQVDVGLGEIHFWTSGPVCVLGKCLEGGYERGSVVVMRSREQPFSVQLDGLIPLANWHGGFNGPSEYWDGKTNEIVARMREPDNCGSGLGCTTVDVIIVEDGRIVDQ